MAKGDAEDVLEVLLSNVLESSTDWWKSIPKSSDFSTYCQCPVVEQLGDCENGNAGPAR